MDGGIESRTFLSRKRELLDDRFFRDDIIDLGRRGKAETHLITRKQMSSKSSMPLIFGPPKLMSLPERKSSRSD